MKKKYHNIILTFIMLLLVFVQANLVSNEIDDYTLKAVLIERFSRLIDWNEESKDLSSENFVITFLGKTEVYNEAKKIYSKRSIKGKKVELILINNIKEITKTHVLYISNKNENIDEVLKVIYNKPILTISEYPNYSQSGVMLNFFKEENKLKYEINPASAKSANLKFSYLLIQNGKVIESND